MIFRTSFSKGHVRFVFGSCWLNSKATLIGCSGGEAQSKHTEVFAPGARPVQFSGSVWSRPVALHRELGCRSYPRLLGVRAPACLSPIRLPAAGVPCFCVPTLRARLDSLTDWVEVHTRSFTSPSDLDSCTGRWLDHLRDKTSFTARSRGSTCTPSPSLARCFEQ